MFSLSYYIEGSAIRIRIRIRGSRIRIRRLGGYYYSK